MQDKDQWREEYGADRVKPVVGSRDHRCVTGAGGYAPTGLKPAPAHELYRRPAHTPRRCIPMAEWRECGLNLTDSYPVHWPARMSLWQVQTVSKSVIERTPLCQLRAEMRVVTAPDEVYAVVGDMKRHEAHRGAPVAPGSSMHRGNTTASPRLSLGRRCQVPIMVIHTGRQTRRTSRQRPKRSSSTVTTNYPRSQFRPERHADTPTFIEWIVIHCSRYCRLRRSRPTPHA